MLRAPGDANRSAASYVPWYVRIDADLAWQYYYRISLLTLKGVFDGMLPVPGSHADYHFSITVHTDDLALLGCLRALSAHAQTIGNARIPWGGTKKKDWERDNHQVTFRFSNPGFRDDFIQEAERLLPKQLWIIVTKNDADPASPQSK